MKTKYMINTHIIGSLFEKWCIPQPRYNSNWIKLWVANHGFSHVHLFTKQTTYLIITSITRITIIKSTYAMY